MDKEKKEGEMNLLSHGYEIVKCREKTTTKEGAIFSPPESRENLKEKRESEKLKIFSLSYPIFFSLPS